MPQDDYQEEYELNSAEKELGKELCELEDKLNELLSRQHDIATEYEEETALLDAKYTEKLATSQSIVKPLEIKHSRLLNKFWDNFLNRIEIDNPDDLTVDFDRFVVFRRDIDDEENCEDCETNAALRVKIKTLEEQLKFKKLLGD
jgi:hypothetical protein